MYWWCISMQGYPDYSSFYWNNSIHYSKFKFKKIVNNKNNISISKNLWRYFNNIYWWRPTEVMASIGSWIVLPNVHILLLRCIQTVLSVFKLASSPSTSIWDIVALIQTSTSWGDEYCWANSCTTVKHIKYLLSDWLIYFNIYFNVQTIQ